MKRDGLFPVDHKEILNYKGTVESGMGFALQRRQLEAAGDGKEVA